eukprot:2658485-Pyramimonas_sp.AAC.1
MGKWGGLKTLVHVQQLDLGLFLVHLQQGAFPFSRTRLSLTIQREVAICIIVGARNARGGERKRGPV